ncbi:MAG: PIN domain-containing protein [Nanoarchaeota archaeon]
MLDKLKEKLTGPKRTKIILDTNILLLPGQSGIDIFTEIERIADFPFTFCTVEEVFRELKDISEGKTVRRRLYAHRNVKKSAKGADKQSAKLGFILGKQKDLKTVGRFSNMSLADDAILAVADDAVMVATLDRKLQRELLERNVPVVTLRQKKYFTIIR